MGSLECGGQEGSIYNCPGKSCEDLQVSKCRAKNTRKRSDPRRGSKGEGGWDQANGTRRPKISPHDVI